MRRKERNLITEWGDRIGWKSRVKAVCKPCWEIRYCPYGPLVEEFPLPAEPDERSCRIFGHHCPVFYVAEPLTETRELRNISRHIPRPMQFRVLKRDNQICAECGKPVLDKDIHFDHIIPWAKGGPTEEHNIRLLCGPCNQKRGTNFEAEYLIQSLGDHMLEPVDSSFVHLLVKVAGSAQEWRAKTGHLPTSAPEFAKMMGVRKVTTAEEMMARMLADLEEFFAGKPPSELDQKVFKALRRRWGFEDGNAYRLKRVTSPEVSLTDLVSAEQELVRRLGWPVKNTAGDNHKWERL